MALPFLDKTSFDLRTRQRRTIDKNVPYCKLKVNLRSKCTLLFCFKDSLDKKICCGISYRYIGSHCKVIYYGKTFTLEPLKRLKKKSLKNNKQSAISDPTLQCNCLINYGDFDLLAADSNKFKYLLMEKLLIKREKNILTG